MSARVTRHQGEVLDRIYSRGIPRGSVVSSERIGSYGACWHLAVKGLVEVVELPCGPRGGRREGYSLTEQGFRVGFLRRWKR